MFIHTSMPYLYVAILLAVVIKIVIVSKYRSPDFVLIFLSFFKIYAQSEYVTNSNSRKRYMLYNNLINFTIYAFTLLCILMQIIFKGK